MIDRPVALTIAGSDSSGGAGIVADLKTFDSLGVWGTTAITAVTAQNTRGIDASFALPPELVRAQIEAIADDLRIGAAKTGMLGSPEIVRVIADAVRLAGIALLVVDPVLVASHGPRLLEAGALDPLRDELLPLATVITPNLPEAAALTGLEVRDREGMVAAAKALQCLGVGVILITGGHLPDREQSPDLLWAEDGSRWLEADRIDAVHTHGTGCVLSAAITAELARGTDPVEACIRGKRFVTGAIHAGLELGRGVGPVDPGWQRPR
jgi:hydroxymethylpyrimidine/phosphomethylpyrimidine kinase